MTALRYLKLSCAYLGTPFFGWQETKEGPSIEGTLRAALEKVLQHPIVLQAASRTDRGVHADAQIVQFATSRWDFDLTRLRYALTGLVSPSIAIHLIEEVPSTFHPTLQTSYKEYCYYLCLSRVQLPFFRETSWHVPKLLNLSLIQQAMLQLTGTHSFRAFCNERKPMRYTDYTRTLFKLCMHELPYQRLKIEIQGDHFLYKMARNIVGTLVQIGTGAFALEGLLDKLSSEDRTQMGMTAPAHGLFLHKVYYEEAVKEEALGEA